MSKSIILILIIIFLSFILGLAFYSQMPIKMASHWNASGAVDGYMPKFWGLFLMPIISVVMFLLFIFIPKIDPLKQNIQDFKKYYENFILILIAFLFYLYVLTLIWNLNVRFNFILFLIPAFALIFYYAGVLISRAKRNWFIGIRTPWTLSNDVVWDKTHRLSAKLFKASAILSLLGIAFPKYAIWFVLVPILLASIYSVVYSYLEYQKQTKK